MSMIAQPASEVSKLMEELNQFLKTSEFSDLDLKRLKKKAEHIKNKVDLTDGFCLLGMIACLESDIAAMMSYCERAIQQSGSDSRVIFNYGICLMYHGLFEEAYERALKAYEKERSYLKALDLLIHLACILYKKEDFEKYTRAWCKITKNNHKLNTYPLFFPIKQKEYRAFLKKYSNMEDLTDGHLLPNDILDACAPMIARIFGTPISVALEIMPNSENKPELIAWIKWFGDIDEGMRRYGLFEDWYIENNYDLKTDLVFFNI